MRTVYPYEEEGVQDRIKRYRNPQAQSPDLFMGSRLALGGPRSLQKMSAMGGRCRTPSPLQPDHRHQPPAPSADRYLGGCWALGGPRSLQRGSGVGGGRWRGGIHRGSLSLQQSAQWHESPPAPTGSQSVPVPHRRAPAEATPVLASEGLAAPAPVTVPCRRAPADTTPVLASEVLAAPVPVLRRRVPGDATPVPASEVLAAHAPVPAPRRRLPADVSLLQASEVLASPAPVPVPHARGSRLTSLLLSLRTLPLSGLKAVHLSLRTLHLRGHRATLPSLRTLPLSSHGAALPSLRTLPLSCHGATLPCLRTLPLCGHGAIRPSPWACPPSSLPSQFMFWAIWDPALESLFLVCCFCLHFLSVIVFPSPHV
ncbi:unnamed protein product [Pleuronectes platessa]|uniref:Uncharacterized protein n=1 Tax=Pleuronectes platessa TaxID=8262 RepID=A0A9N7TJL6_PLEPL|nr:unnamed protein product [Pleuronectes platessa]